MARKSNTTTENTDDNIQLSKPEKRRIAAALCRSIRQGEFSTLLARARPVVQGQNANQESEVMTLKFGEFYTDKETGEIGRCVPSLTGYHVIDFPNSAMYRHYNDPSRLRKATRAEIIEWIDEAHDS
jgi:hypothetical protein